MLSKHTYPYDSFTVHSVGGLTTAFKYVSETNERGSINWFRVSMYRFFQQNQTGL